MPPTETNELIESICTDPDVRVRMKSGEFATFRLLPESPDLAVRTRNRLEAARAFAAAGAKEVHVRIDRAYYHYCADVHEAAERWCRELDERARAGRASAAAGTQYTSSTHHDRGGPPVSGA